MRLIDCKKAIKALTRAETELTDDDIAFILENQPTIEAIPKADVVAMLDKIRAEIIKYEGDCRLSVDEYPSCKQCTDNVFKTIYGVLDKYKAESEG